MTQKEGKAGLPTNTLSLGLPRSSSSRVPREATAGGNGPSMSVSSQRRADIAIRSTDQDAVVSRMSAIHQGYLQNDPYTPLLASNEYQTISPGFSVQGRRSPIINIGTYLRCTTIDCLVDRFLQEGQSLSGRKKQIISLGAGSDARFWRIHADPKSNNVLQHYVELDFSEMTNAKLQRIRRNPQLFQAVAENVPTELTADQTTLMSPQYSLIACDLRDLVSDKKSRDLIESIIDPSLDTLILAECVLTYMSPQDSNALLEYLGALLKRPFAICYEMCVAGDAEISASAPPSRFGNVMLANLETRNLNMPGARRFSTVGAQATRFKKAFGCEDEGQDRAESLKHVWLRTSETEKKRLSRLEGLDEVEELEMLLAHYAISWFAFDSRSVEFMAPI